MWSTLIPIALGFLKWVMEKQAKRKISDAEFIGHIQAFQIAKSKAGEVSENFEDALSDAKKKLAPPTEAEIKSRAIDTSVK